MSATEIKTNGRARAPRVLPAPAEPAPAPRPAGSPLDAAVLAVQAAAPKLIRNADGQVGPRTYRYVTNDQVVDVVLPLLVEHELLWRTFPTTDEHGAPALRYRMTHVPSGESDEDVMSLMVAHNDPQGQGSGITYARRYALTAYLNLTIDQDDDGRGGGARDATSIPSASQPSAAPARQTDRPCSAKQRALLSARAGQAGLTPVQFANIVMLAKGDQPRDTDDQDAAARWLKRELDRLPARLVDVVLEGIEAS